MPNTELPFSVDAATMRRIEHWALLNVFIRPHDLPPGTNEAQEFRELTHAIPRAQRMEFWNGAFRRGLARKLFV